MKLFFLRLFGLLVFITYISNNPYKTFKMSSSQEDLLVEIYYEIEEKGLMNTSLVKEPSWIATCGCDLNIDRARS